MEKDAWVCRYDTKDRNSLVEQDIELVKYFEAKYLGAIPGASIYLNNGGFVKMDTAAWNWLRPLLIELKKLRERAAYEKMLVDACKFALEYLEANEGEYGTESRIKLCREVISKVQEEVPNGLRSQEETQ